MPYAADDLINCTCKRQVLKVHYESHMKQGEQTRLLKKPIDDRVLDPINILGEQMH